MRISQRKKIYKNLIHGCAKRATSKVQIPEKIRKIHPVKKKLWIFSDAHSTALWNPKNPDIWLSPQKFLHRGICLNLLLPKIKKNLEKKFFCSAPFKSCRRVSLKPPQRWAQALPQWMSDKVVRVWHFSCPNCFQFCGIFSFFIW